MRAATQRAASFGTHSSQPKSSAELSAYRRCPSVSGQPRGRPAGTRKRSCSSEPEPRRIAEQVPTRAHRSGVEGVAYRMDHGGGERSPFRVELDVSAFRGISDTLTLAYDTSWALGGCFGHGFVEKSNFRTVYDPVVHLT